MSVLIRLVSQIFARGTHVLTGSGPCCRFQPTCSDYVQNAFENRGFGQAVLLSVKRIARCHPWGGSGFDPLPGK